MRDSAPRASGGQIIIENSYPELARGAPLIMNIPETTGRRLSVSLLACSLLLGAFSLPAAEEKASELAPRPISFSEVLSLALENNFDIRLARLEQKINRYNIPISRSVYDTLLSAEADYTYDRFKKSSDFYGGLNKTGNLDLSLSKKFPWGTDLSLGFSNQYSSSDSFFTSMTSVFESSLQVSFSQPLLKDWGGMITRGEIEMVRLDVNSFDLLAWENIEAALALAARTYWELAEIREEVRLEEQMEERARYLYELTRKHLELGIVEEVDLVAAEANLRIREAEVVLDRERLVTTSRLLQFLLGEAGPGLLLPAEALNVPESGVADTLDECLNVAIKNRWDYLIARNDLEAEEINLDLKENGRWPEVDLVGSFARNGVSEEWGEAVDRIFSEENPQYYVGLQLSYFLENRLAGSELDQAELEKARALLRIKQVEQEIYTEVDDKLRASRVSLELARRQEVIERLQREKLDEEEKRFKYGRSNSKTVIDYQHDLLLAQLSLAQAVTVYHQSLIDLQVAQGVFLRKQMGMD